jgi:myo-inositol 2-dehydrogenase/D-chiro-inositol 1-dehydrogenase
LIKSTAAGVTKAKPVRFFLERYLPAYRAEWSAFISALTGGPPVPVTLADGVLALAMAEAATQSAKTGLPVLLADI